MFIIGYSRYCTIFSYHFFIIVALDWFSSTTHLSTLTVLQDYFKDSTGLKYTRLLGMLANFVFLFVGLLEPYTDLPFGVRVQCRFDRISIHVGSPLKYICMVLVLCYINIIYVSKSLVFCFNGQRQFSSIRGLLFYLTRRHRHPLRRDYHRQRLKDASASQSLSPLGYLGVYFITFNFVFAEFLDSFLWEYSGSFSTISTASDNCSGLENTWEIGFGKPKMRMRMRGVLVNCLRSFS